MERYISFCGINGAGKTTQADLLAKRLRDQGEDVVVVKNPGTTPIGEAMREMVVNRRHGRLDATSAILAHTIAHRVTVMQVVEPALRSGAVVIEDRGAFCGRVYAGAEKDSMASKRKYAALSAAMHNDYVPRRADLNILLDIDAASAHRRLRRRLDVEDRPKTCHLEIRNSMRLSNIRRSAYLTLAHANPDKFMIFTTFGNEDELDARLLADQIFDAVYIVGGDRKDDWPRPSENADWVLA